MKRHFNLPAGEYAFAIMYEPAEPTLLFFTPFRSDEPRPLALFSLAVNRKNAKPNLEEEIAEGKISAALHTLLQQELPHHIDELRALMMLLQTSLKDPKDPIHQRILRRTGWLTTRFSLPTKIEEEGEPFFPDVIAWVKAESGEVLGFDLVHPSEGDSALLPPLKKLIRQHGVPPSICVEKESIANVIRGAFKGMTVLVDELPELLLVRDGLLSQLAEETRPDPTYLGDGAPPDDVATLFQAAAKLFRAAPWKKWGDYPMLQIDAPALDIKGGAISLMGKGKTSYGFLFFDDGSDAQDFYDIAADSEDDDFPEVPFLVLEFCPASEVSNELRKEIAGHTWEVASTKSFPVLKRMNEAMESQPLTKRDILVATACCEAILFFYAAHHKKLAAHEEFTATATLKNEELGDMSLAWPHPDVDVEEELTELPEELGKMLFEALSKQEKPKSAAKKTSTKKTKKPTPKKVTPKKPSKKK